MTCYVYVQCSLWFVSHSLGYDVVELSEHSPRTEQDLPQEHAKDSHTSTCDKRTYVPQENVLYSQPEQQEP
jgi:hypothetical protein